MSQQHHPEIRTFSRLVYISVHFIIVDTFKTNISYDFIRFTDKNFRLHAEAPESIKLVVSDAIKPSTP